MLSDKVTNSVDGRSYSVNTISLRVGTNPVQQTRATARGTPMIWAHDVTSGGVMGFGVKRLYAAVSRDEPAAQAEHARLVAVAREQDPAIWRMSEASIREVSDLSARLIRELGRENPPPTG